MATRVLLGDSAPSELPSNILDTIVELCICARDVSVAHEEIAARYAQLEQSEASFAEIAEHLQRFRRVGESGLRSSVDEATRPEMKEHGHQAADALGRMVEGWLGQYQGTRDREVAARRGEIAELHRRMNASLDRFALPLRAQPSRRMVQRRLEGAAYIDTATIELLPGLRVKMTLEDTEPEQPRKLRSLLGKGIKVQVGTVKKGLIRRTEEPAFVGLDDLVILSAEISAETAKLDLAKKAGGAVVLRLGLSASGGRVLGQGVLPDGGGNQLPEEDGPVLEKLWAALQSEAERIVSSPARSEGYALRDELVETPAGYVNVVERMVEHYRPSIRMIMEHSPNAEELTVKVEAGERREEKWVRRDELAGHLSKVPATFADRLCVPEVVDPSLLKRAAPAALPPGDDAPPAVARAPRAEPATPPPPPRRTEPSELKATAAYQRVPVEEVLVDDTQDISLTELEVSGEELDEDLDEDLGQDLESQIEDELDAQLDAALGEQISGEIEASSGGLPVPELGRLPPPASAQRRAERAPVKKPPPPASLRRKPSKPS